jgi:hypothetical protein
MAHYRMYLLDSRNKISSGLDLTCTDDRDAVAQARSQAENRAFEVWQSTRRVFPDTIQPSQMPATTHADRYRPPALARFIQELLLAC